MFGMETCIFLQEGKRKSESPLSEPGCYIRTAAFSCCYLQRCVNHGQPCDGIHSNGMSSLRGVLTQGASKQQSKGVFPTRDAICENERTVDGYRSSILTRRLKARSMFHTTWTPHTRKSDSATVSHEARREQCF